MAQGLKDGAIPLTRHFLDALDALGGKAQLRDIEAYLREHNLPHRKPSLMRVAIKLLETEDIYRPSRGLYYSKNAWGLHTDTFVEERYGLLPWGRTISSALILYVWDNRPDEVASWMIKRNVHFKDALIDSNAARRLLSTLTRDGHLLRPRRGYYLLSEGAEQSIQEVNTYLQGDVFTRNHRK